LKRLSIIQFLLFILIGSNAQIKDNILIGIIGGLTYSNTMVDFDFPSSHDFIKGFNSGASIELELNSNITIETNISYYQNGFKISDEDTIRAPDFKFSKSYIGFEEKIRQNYLNNSWLVGYSIGNKIEFSVYTGLYWAILLNSNYKIKSYIFVDSLEWTEFGSTSLQKGYHESNFQEQVKGYTSFDYGFIGRIELGINLNQRLQMTCFSGYYQGFGENSKTGSDDEVRIFNSSFNVGLGLKYNL